MAVPLYAFIDESGIHEGARCCILAGYVGSLRQWRWFENRWERALRRIPGKPKVFHAKDFFGGSSPYRELTRAQREQLIDELVNAIESLNLNPFGALVDTAAFNALTYGERCLITGGGFDGQKFRTSGAPLRPYFVGFQHCVIEAARKAKPGMKVAYVFEEQRAFANLALQLFQILKFVLEPSDRESINGCAFFRKEDAPPLQAADLLANCWYRYVSQNDTLDPLRRRAMRRLTLKAPGLRHYNAEGFELLLGKLPPEIRARLRVIKDPGGESGG